MVLSDSRRSDDDSGFVHEKADSVRTDICRYHRSWRDDLFTDFKKEQYYVRQTDI
jgi:hypothetical protein